jgi:hypothetical protein
LADKPADGGSTLVVVAWLAVVGGRLVLVLVLTGAVVVSTDRTVVVGLEPVVVGATGVVSGTDAAVVTLGWAFGGWGFPHPTIANAADTVTTRPMVINSGLRLICELLIAR